MSSSIKAKLHYFGCRWFSWLNFLFWEHWSSEKYQRWSVRIIREWVDYDDESLLEIAAGILSSISMFPQLIKVIEDKNAESCLGWWFLFWYIDFHYGMVRIAKRLDGSFSQRHWPYRWNLAFLFAVSCIMIIPNKLEAEMKGCGKHSFTQIFVISPGNRTIGKDFHPFIRLLLLVDRQDRHLVDFEFAIYPNEWLNLAVLFIH